MTKNGWGGGCGKGMSPSPQKRKKEKLPNCFQRFETTILVRKVTFHAKKGRGWGVQEISPPKKTTVFKRFENFTGGSPHHGDSKHAIRKLPQTIRRCGDSTVQALMLISLPVQYGTVSLTTGRPS